MIVQDPLLTVSRAGSHALRGLCHDHSKEVLKYTPHQPHHVTCVKHSRLCLMSVINTTIYSPSSSVSSCQVFVVMLVFCCMCHRIASSLYVLSSYAHLVYYPCFHVVVVL